ncbi:MAG: hypothetical protein KDE20_03220 [Caldilineaceae bacterium]|nr:hypothetical protein [Caldilineaceae bacterium]
MLRVPDAFARDTIAREGDAGRAWIEALPATFAALCDEWKLTVDGPPLHGYVGLVLPVRRGSGGPDAEACVLKLTWQDADTAGEARALAAWNGRGAVQLLAADADRGALLLERLDPTRTLDHIPIGDAVVLAGELLHQLTVPAPDGIHDLPTLAGRKAAALPGLWEATGRRVPRRAVDYAVGIMRELGMTDLRLLTNYDLHYQNVLAGTRAPWLVIDPKVTAGDPAFSPAQLLWCRLEDMEAAGGLLRHLDALIEAAHLDPQRTRAWSVARCVDYWLWALSVGLTEDPRRCERIVATLLPDV